jgi:starch phosphorylase
LAKNLWWSWHPEVVNLFRDLDPVKWRKVDHNPIVMLAEMTPDQLAERAAEMVLYTRINQAHRRLKEYLSNSRHTWGARETGVLGSKPVAYFSAEFGLHESVPI